ncbi:MAG: HEAT repeat domain-containing protein [Solirubrobacterales bacterium]
MTRSLLRVSFAAMAMLVLSVPATFANAQSTEELISQLCGKAQAPARDATQLAEAYQKAFDYLLPLMSAEDVGSRYAPQIVLQDMGSYAARPGAEIERETLAKVLAKNVDQPNMPNTVRHWIVFQLERIGKGESVPCLTKLMSDPDEHLRDYARRALEKNPDSAATDALLKTLADAKDAKWKIGVINALGTRRAATAIEPLTSTLGDSDPKVAAAAVTALSNIGSQDAATGLARVFNMPVSALYMKASQGMIDIAQEMLRQNSVAAAAEVYTVLYEGATQFARNNADANPFAIRAAGIVGMMMCDPEKSAARMPEWMQDKDPKVRAAVVQAARRTPSKTPVRTLTSLLSGLDPQSQVQALALIADRGDLSSVDPVKKVLASSDESVQLAAIETLTRIGTDDGVEALLPVAVGGSGEAQKAAREGLALIAGPRVDEAISAHAAAGEANVRAVAIDLLGKRHMPEAAKTLLAYAGDADEQISRAAFAAIVDVADAVDVSTLADLLAKAKSGGPRDSAVTALRAVLSAAKDKDAAAEAVVNRMKAADADVKIAMLSSLDASGTTTALAVVCEAAQSADGALSDAGIRTLSNWPSFEGAETLVAIASKPETSLTHYVLATRGALRLISVGDSAPMDQRVALCLATFDHARRDEEKKQAVATLGALPCQKAIDRLGELIKVDALKTEAALATVDLAGRMLFTDRDAAKALAQKIRDMNISDEVNRRADAVISGRFRGRK